MTLNRLVDSGQPLPTPDVQRTTFSMDAIARFVCNTWEEILAAQAGGEFDANNYTVKLKVRSMVGLIPLFAVETIESETLKQFPAFKVG